MNYTEKSIKEILGEELYEACFSYFLELYERKSHYKIIMTRRCFSLYKIFKPILESNGYHNCFGEILTDKAVEFYIEEIAECFKNSKNEELVLTVFDDVIIYGRTINGWLDTFIEKMTKHTNFSNKRIKDCVLVRCLMYSQFCPQIKEAYKDMIIPNYYGNKKDWQFFSNGFSTVIKYCDVANTSYIVSYKRGFEESEYSSILNHCKNIANCNGNKDLEKLNVEYYVSVVENLYEKTIFDEFIQTSWLRIYCYPQLGSINISPLVVLKSLKEEQVDKLSKELVRIFSLNENQYLYKILLDKRIDFYTIKIQLITLILSHFILCDFLRNNKQISFNNLSENNFDSKEIFSYNFLPQLEIEFNELTQNWVHSIDRKYRYSQYEGTFETNKKFKKYLFKKAMLDNQAAVSGQQERTDGFNLIGDISVFEKFFMPQILTYIDQGKAGLKTIFTKEGMFESRIYSGEQAFKIMSDSFICILPYLSRLENYAKIYDLNQYKIYDDFITFWNIRQDFVELEEDIKDYLEILKETQQDISDIYFCNSDLEEKLDMSVLNEFLNERSQKS